MHTKNMIKLLSDVTRADIALVGGKAASLGEMIQADLRVPPGFAVTTDGFRQGMTNELDLRIQNAFDQLKLPRVAVRSSAVAEDSLTASWAGQLDTYLNVTKDGVIEAVQNCWQSIESKHAKSYAETNNVSEDQRAVAVVVQAMVDSEIAGVMFTANPVTGDREQCVIEAVYGLGELLVQGATTPEHFTLNKSTGSVVSHSAHQQDKMLVYRDGQNQTVDIPAHEPNQPMLTSEQLRELLGVAKKLEEHYAKPQDIEWAIANKKLYIVQSRPITTLTTHDVVDSKPLPDWADDDIFRWGPVRSHYFLFSDYIVAVYQHLPESYPSEHFPPALILFNNAHMLWMSRLTVFMNEAERIFKGYVEKPQLLKKMYKDWQQALTNLIAFHAQLKRTDLTALTSPQLVTLWQDFYDCLKHFWVPTLLPELGNYASPSLFKADLSEYIKAEEEHINAQEILTTPEELSFYQHEELELMQARDLKAHQSKYFWLKNSYGHVGVLPVEFFEERQKELRAKLKPVSPDAIKQKTIAAKQRIQDHYNLPRSLVKRAKLITDNMVWQDQRKRYMTENFHYKHLLLAEVGRRVGVATNDLLKLSNTEAIKLLETLTKPNTSYRKQWFGLCFDTSLSTLSTAQTKTYWVDYAYEKTSDTNTIKGVTASKGDGKIVRARVRVLHTSHEMIEPGEILVTPMTTPGYVFAMHNAAAVVTDIGGMTIHAAIVSRELNIPCIVGTKIATQALKTGDLVEVDPTHGTITIIESPASDLQTG